MRLIDADALKKDIARLHSLNDEAEIRRAYASNPHSTMTDFEDTMVSVFDAIDDAPTIDAVSVVRCGECKHMYDGIKGDGYLICHKFNHFIKADDFCSYGERRADGQDIQSATE